MNPDKFDQSVEKMEMVLKSLRNTLDGISKNNVNQEDLRNVEEGLSTIQANARSCL